MLSVTAPRPGLAQGVTIDPCTPRNYKRSAEENARHSKTVSTATHSPVSTIISRGNFSECREAAYSLLQHGHGNECSFFMLFNPEVPKLKTERPLCKLIVGCSNCQKRISIVQKSRYDFY